MGAAKPYNPNEVIIYLGGVLVDGFADGDFLSIEQQSPQFKEEVGTSGEVAVSKTNDRRLKITVKTIQTSAANLAFSAMAQTARNSPASAGKLFMTFQMEDLSGKSICNATQAWIIGMAPATYDRTAKSREWEIHTADGDWIEGGN